MEAFGVRHVIEHSGRMRRMHVRPPPVRAEVETQHNVVDELQSIYSGRISRSSEVEGAPKVAARKELTSGRQPHSELRLCDTAEPSMTTSMC